MTVIKTEVGTWSSSDPNLILSKKTHRKQPYLLKGSRRGSNEIKSRRSRLSPEVAKTELAYGI